MEDTDNDDVSRWIQDLSDGDDDAARQIWEKYFSQLVGYARGKMRGMPRRSSDEEDIALSAMHSFVRGLQRGKFPELNDRNELWKLLLTITARKAHAERRRSLRKKRGDGQVRGESVFLEPGGDGDRFQGMEQFLGAAPTPELAAMFLENTEKMIHSLEDETLREIALAKLEGFTTEEIAQRQGVVTRTIERKLHRIRAVWQKKGFAEHR